MPVNLLCEAKECLNTLESILDGMSSVTLLKGKKKTSNSTLLEKVAFCLKLHDKGIEERYNLS